MSEAKAHVLKDLFDRRSCYIQYHNHMKGSAGELPVRSRNEIRRRQNRGLLNSRIGPRGDLFTPWAATGIIDSPEKHVGFIFEEVPELIATKDRKGLSPMDIVAVLTKIVQEQQKTISMLSRRITELEKKVT